jgi:phage terminase large subunit-like protein
MTQWPADRIERVARTGVPGYDAWRGADRFTFSHATARRYLEFIESCCTFTAAAWAGQPFILQDWQAAIVANLFGWLKADGTRRFRKCLIFIARKAGKTELAAAIAIALLYIDGEKTPEIVCAAGNAEQAETMFKAASAMVNQEDELSSRSRISRRAIESTTNGGILKVINSASTTKHGANLHAALVDELHVHKSADLLDVLETSMKARRQAMTIITTTAGDSEESPAYEAYHYASRVRDGLADDPEFLPVIYEAPKDADITSLETWRAAMPSLGVTVPIEDYQRELHKAQQIPRYANTFKRLSLNQWVESATAWIGVEDWRACAGPLDFAALKGHRATIGLDLSSTVDTTCAVACVEVGDKLALFPFIFIPRESAAGVIKRQKRDRAPYMTWLQSGAIEGTPGNCVDYEAVEAKVIELSKHFDLIEVQADPYNASGLLERLIKAGLQVSTVRQGFSLAEATKETERLILSRGLIHADNPAFNWQWSCAACATDRHDNQWPIKDKSTGRIDSVVAAVMGVNAMRFGKGREGGGGSYYEQNPEPIFV